MKYVVSLIEHYFAIALLTVKIQSLLGFAPDHNM